MSEPTPGPWTELHVGEDMVIVAAEQPLIDGATFGIAIIPNMAGANKIPWATKVANGRLITAAPDLLAACEADAAFWDHFRDCRSCAFLNNRKFCDVGQALREQAEALRAAAVKKAKGGTP